MKKILAIYAFAILITLLVLNTAVHCQSISGLSSAQFHWRKVSGPYCTIVSPYSANTVVKNMQQGIYLFEFKITFASGNVARDTVKVTVKPRRSH